MDIRRLSDLNITLDPHLDRDTESEEEMQRRRSSLSQLSQVDSFEDDDGSAWLSDALLDSPLFKDTHHHGNM